VTGSAVRWALPLLPAAALFVSGCLAGVDIRTQQAQASFLEGQAYLQGKNLNNEINRRQAYPRFRDAVENDPEKPLYRIGLGTIYFYDGKLDLAEEQFKAALRLDPTNAEARNSLGSVYSNRGKYREAIQEFDQALANYAYLTPQISHFNKGQAYFELKDWENAVTSYRAALAVQPGIETAWLNTGLALEKLGRLGEADRALRKVLEINPDSVKARYNLGLVLFRQKRNREAGEEFKRVIEMEPETDLGRNASGYLLLLR
jgi:tetratricopeptide (TPR) repeat protein